MQVAISRKVPRRWAGIVAALGLGMLACVAWAGLQAPVSACNLQTSKAGSSRLLVAIACLSKAIPVLSGGVLPTTATAAADTNGTATPIAATGLHGVVAEGDTASVFWGGNHTGIYASTHPAVEFHGLATGGARLSDTQGGNGLEQRLATDLALHPAVVTVLIGTNDLGDGTYSSADQWLASLWRYVAQVKATGARVAVATVLPVCASWDADFNARTAQRRPIVNAAIRKAVGTSIDAVIDFANDPEIGPDSAACDRKWYKDGLQPSDGAKGGVGGQGRMAMIYAAVVDSLLPAAAPLSAPTETPSTLPSGPLAAGLTPIASNFDRNAWLVTGYDPRGDGSHIPVSAAPDDQGAFRFICAPGQMSYDDPILYPGQQGKAHLHQFYGNTGADYRSTYASLRGAGDSTCSNALNRSAYWIPALLNAAGQVIRPDYMSIYYKRNPASDGCKKVAAQGCVDIPAGLRVVSGYDMSRMGQSQPDNANFFFRCLDPGSAQEHRSLLSQAIADCGGEGQVMATVGFGPCWSGQLDSADHRSHLAQPSYGYWGYPRCDDAHPYLIPTLTQQIAYTIRKVDGAVSFSSDRMNGMNMAGGTTFHADYMEGWDPATRETWHRNCINKLLNCSDGELGDGTMLKRAALNYVADPRIVAAPVH